MTADSGEGGEWEEGDDVEGVHFDFVVMMELMLGRGR